MKMYPQSSQSKFSMIDMHLQQQTCQSGSECSKKKRLKAHNITADKYVLSNSKELKFAKGHNPA